MDLVGTDSTGFGRGYITPCGTDELILANGLPGFEFCIPADNEPHYIRVRGVLIDDGGTPFDELCFPRSLSGDRVHPSGRG